VFPFSLARFDSGWVVVLARNQPPSKTSVIARFRGLACTPVVVSPSCSHISNEGLVSKKGNEINAGVPYTNELLSPPNPRKSRPLAVPAATVPVLDNAKDMINGRDKVMPPTVV